MQISGKLIKCNNYGNENLLYISAGCFCIDEVYQKFHMESYYDHG